MVKESNMKEVWMKDINRRKRIVVPEDVVVHANHVKLFSRSLEIPWVYAITWPSVQFVSIMDMRFVELSMKLSVPLVKPLLFLAAFMCTKSGSIESFQQQIRIRSL